MIRHLLIPLDGSPMAECILPMAAWLAHAAGARVTLLHVIEQKTSGSVHGEQHLSDPAEAERYFEAVAARAFERGTDVTWHVHARQVRDVAHSVVDHTDEFEPDLVIMCPHGEGGLRDWLHGSIPQQVVRRSAAPVLLMRPAADGAIRFPFKSILAPLDGKPGHEQGLPVAADLARLCGAALRLVTAVPTVGTLSGPQAAVGGLLPEATRAMLQMVENDAAHYLGLKIQELHQTGLAAHASVVRGEPLDVIAQAAAQAQADLVALGTHGKAGTEAFWTGSLAQRLIHHIPASFLLAPAA